jgi:serine/threonine-protein kinase
LSDIFKTGSFIVGTYRVLDFIGEGAMGLVYKVEHNLLNKILAFKVLKTEHLSESAWKRFHIEAQALKSTSSVWIDLFKIFDL